MPRERTGDTDKPFTLEGDGFELPVPETNAFWPSSVALWAFLSARKCAVAPGGIEIDYEVTIKALACRISGHS